MVQENSERLKKYLDMISRKEGGVEGVMHKLTARRQPVEESLAEIQPTRSKARKKPATAALESVARGKDIPPEDYAQAEAIIFEDHQAGDHRRRWNLHGRPSAVDTAFGRRGDQGAHRGGDPAGRPHRVAGQHADSLWRHRLYRRAGAHHDQPARRRPLRRWARRQAAVLQERGCRRHRPEA